MYGIVMDMTSLSHMVYLSMAALMGMCIIIILLQMLIYLLPLFVEIYTCSYSQRVLWLEIENSNNNPLHIAHYVLTTVQNVGGR